MGTGQVKVLQHKYVVVGEGWGGGRFYAVGTGQVKVLQVCGYVYAVLDYSVGERGLQCIIGEEKRLSNS